MLNQPTLLLQLVASLKQVHPCFPLIGHRNHRHGDRRDGRHLRDGHHDDASDDAHDVPHELPTRWP